MKINIECKSDRHLLEMQVMMMIGLSTAKRTKEMRVLCYMLGHSVGGRYLVKRGHRSEMAKYLGIGDSYVKRILDRLVKKCILQFVGNASGNNLGVYVFAKSVSVLGNGQSEIKMVFNRPKTN